MKSSEQCQKVNKVLADNGVGAINFSENSWHFYPSWEHLHEGSTVTASGWPFAEPGGKRRVVYDPQVLPKSADIMSRTLVYPVSIKMSDEQLQKMCSALEKAAKV